MRKQVILGIFLLSAGWVHASVLGQDNVPPPAPKPPVPKEIQDEGNAKTDTPDTDPAKPDVDPAKPEGKVEVDRKPGERPRVNVEGNVNPDNPNAPRGKIEVEGGRVKIQGRLNENSQPIQGEFQLPNRRNRVDGEVVPDRVDDRIDRREDRLDRREDRVEDRIDRRIDGRVEGQIDGRIDGRVDGRIDGRYERPEAVRGEFRSNQRAKLGVHVQWQNGLARIDSVIPETAAAIGGMQAGDEIVAINRHRVANQPELTRQLMLAAQENEQATVHAFRDGMLQEFQVTLKLETVDSSIQADLNYNDPGRNGQGSNGQPYRAYSVDPGSEYANPDRSNIDPNNNRGYQGNNSNSGRRGLFGRGR